MGLRFRRRLALQAPGRGLRVGSSRRPGQCPDLRGQLPLRAVKRYRLPLLCASLCLGAGSLFAKPLVVDTFDSGMPKNALEGSTNVWGDATDKSVFCAMSFDNRNRMGEEGYGLRLDYDIESAKETVF